MVNDTHTRRRRLTHLFLIFIIIIIIIIISFNSGNKAHFINDIDKGIVIKLLKFSDDTKLVGTVSSEVELEQLRTDLKLLYSWSVDWQMLFNTDKCKVMHFGYKNTTAGYSLGDVNIQSGKEEEDLGSL